MPGPRPGSHKYDIKRARLRKSIEDSGRAADQEANDVANEILQEGRGQEGILRSERGLGPKGERAPGERK
ncbi:MAG TPA: phosphatidylethanolamine-binding protein [Micromonosporaceae bacterium]|nr:phosphatidylethanolamine-binding protein [Micromonosporaceae bacterium]